METTTSFDLNRAIQQWRQNLGQSPALRDENLYELEAHLRDSVAQLQTRGLSPEESFLIAVKRIGKDNVLANEFGKVNGKTVWLDRFLWVLIGIQGWNWVGAFTNTLTSNVIFSNLSRWGYNAGAHGAVIPVTILTLANLVGFVGSLGVCWWLIRRYRQALGLRLKAAFQTRGTFVLTIAVIGLLCLNVALMVLANGFMPIHYSDEQTSAMYTLWGAFSTNLAGAIKTVSLVALTVFLAQKRLRMREA